MGKWASLNQFDMYEDVAQQQADDLIDAHMIGNGYFEGGAKNKEMAHRILDDLVDRGIVTHARVAILITDWIRGNKR